MLEELWETTPTCFEALPLLVALRKEDKKKILNQNNECLSVDSYLSDLPGIKSFLSETGLRDFLIQSNISNLVDYAFGLEVGLDTNARKNRVGKLMEHHISSLLDRASIPYDREVYSSTFPEVAQVLGADAKRFDFVLKTIDKIYLVEVNFYTSGGSKLNEVARSYSELAPRINALSNFEFVWITDGIGWLKAKNKLEEAFSIIPRIYNLTSFPDFIAELKQNI